MVREVVDDNGGEYQCKTSTRPVAVLPRPLTLNISTDTDVNEFLVRQMSGLFSPLDIELWQVGRGGGGGGVDIS